MPYIPQEQRDILKGPIDELLAKAQDIPGWQEQRAGLLNYIVTMLAQGMLGNETRYAKINDIVGALECAKLEFYRRLAAPYEDTKIDSAGDVYGE